MMEKIITWLVLALIGLLYVAGLWESIKFVMYYTGQVWHFYLPFQVLSTIIVVFLEIAVTVMVVLGAMLRIAIKLDKKYDN